MPRRQEPKKDAISCENVWELQTSLIRGYPNGATIVIMSPSSERKETWELKHLSSRRKKSNEIPTVAASEEESPNRTSGRGLRTGINQKVKSKVSGKGTAQTVKARRRKARARGRYPEYHETRETLQGSRGTTLKAKYYYGDR